MDVLSLFETKWFGDCTQAPPVERPLRRSNSGGEATAPVKAGVPRRSSASDLLDIQTSGSRLKPQTGLVERQDGLANGNTASTRRQDTVAITRDAATNAALGTWAGRQSNLLGRKISGADAPTTIPEDSSLAVPSRPDPPTTQPLPMHGDDESNAMHEAWRWRMCRKFQMEQARINSMNGDEEEWTEALQYLVQAEQQANLQFGPMQSLERFPSISSPNMSQTLTLLLDGSDSFRGSFDLQRAGSSEVLAATKQINNTLTKAQTLLKQQQEIERQLDAKWEQSMRTEGGGSEREWGDHIVQPVVYDVWGKFQFIIAKAHQQAAGYPKLTKLLLRGRNGLQAEQVFSQLQTEVARAATQQRVPYPKLELLGSGEMFWSTENNTKCLNITAKKVHSLSDGRIQSKRDIGRVASTIAEPGAGQCPIKVLQD